MSSILLIRLINSAKPNSLTGIGYYRHLTNVNLSPDNRATSEQLFKLETTLSDVLPKFFTNPHPFALYTQDVTFINNIRNSRIQGIPQYALQLALIKLYYEIKCSYRRVELLNLVKNPEESCIKIRWRLVTKPGLLKIATSLDYRRENWKDGISTFHVNKDGKIYCHVCDNIDVQTNQDTKTATKGSALKNTLINKGLNV